MQFLLQLVAEPSHGGSSLKVLYFWASSNLGSMPFARFRVLDPELIEQKKVVGVTDAFMFHSCAK